MSRWAARSRPKKVFSGASPSPRTLVMIVAPVAPPARAASSTMSVFSSLTRATISFSFMDQFSSDRPAPRLRLAQDAAME